MLGDHFKLINCPPKTIRTRQSCLTSGGVRIASGHWVGNGIRPAFRFRPRAGVWEPPFWWFEYTPYLIPRSTPEKEEVVFSHPHSPWMINCSPPEPARLHLSQASYPNKSISCLSLWLLLNSFCVEAQRTWTSVSPDIGF